MATTAAVLSYDEIMEQLSSFELEDDMAPNFDKLIAKYSERNVMLLMMQSGGNATDVRGYRQWESAGRRVRKGEKSMKILAPAGKAKDKKTGEETDRMLFRLASVFDIAATDPIE